VALVREETGTSAWWAFRTGPSSFGIFDVFPDEPARAAHIAGKLAKALFAKAPELLAGQPTIGKADILAEKL
jgi:quinol monooxygenase YgiN